ncbi:hypothetical protein Tco_1225167 [Tanacetum coccineum]
MGCGQPCVAFIVINVRASSPLNGGFCSFCALRAGNSFAYDPNPNSFIDSPSVFTHPPQLQFETYLCKLYGNNVHYGYDCPPQFPLIRLIDSYLSLIILSRSSPVNSLISIQFTRICRGKPTFDLEEEIRLVENLSYDNSSPRPPEELNMENYIESFPLSRIPVEYCDPFMEEIDVFLAY